MHVVITQVRYWMWYRPDSGDNLEIFQLDICSAVSVLQCVLNYYAC